MTPEIHAIAAYMAETLAIDPYDADPAEVLDEATAAWESPPVQALRLTVTALRARIGELEDERDKLNRELLDDAFGAEHTAAAYDALAVQRDAVKALLDRYGTDPDIGGLIATIDVIRDLSEALGVTE